MQQGASASPHVSLLMTSSQVAEMDDAAAAAASSYNGALLPAHSQKMTYATYDDTVSRLSWNVNLRLLKVMHL